MKLCVFKCIFILMICMDSAKLNDGLRILGLFPFSSKSHFSICGALMKGLAAKGHQVDVYSIFPLKKPMQNYNHFDLTGMRPHVTNNVTYDIMSVTYGPKMLKYWIEMHANPICELMATPIFQKLLHNPPKDPPYDVIVVEIYDIEVGFLYIGSCGDSEKDAIDLRVRLMINEQNLIKKLETSQVNINKAISIVFCFIPWGRYFNIPVVGIASLPTPDYVAKRLGTPVNYAIENHIFSAYSYNDPMTFVERLLNVLVSKAVDEAFKSAVSLQDKDVEKHLGPGYPSVVESIKDLSLLLANHNLAISEIKPLSPNVVPIGGLHIYGYEDESLVKEVKQWLDESEHGCIFFTFGSMTRIETFPKPLLSIFYQTFKNIAPVRVLLKVVKPAELPPGLPSNVLTQTWLQQNLILQHKNLKAFVTHGGMMGTQEAVYYGVPMVGLPLFADQHYNLYMYLKKQIAIRVDIHSITVEIFTNALKEILYNPKYRLAIQKVSRQFRDQPLSPIDNAVYWIEYVHRYGKDVLKPSEIHMPWWKASLIDVYCFILSVVLLILYFALLLFKKIINIILLKYYRERKSKQKSS